MDRILEIFSFQGGYKGGVATMVQGYIESQDLFIQNGCSLEHLNIAPLIKTGISKLDNLIYIFTQRRAVIRQLKNNKYDVIHIHTSREYLFLKDVLLAKEIKKKFNIPIVITIHVGSMNTVFNRIGFFKNNAFTILNNFLDKIIFLSERMRQDFVKDGLSEKRTTVLYNFHQIPTDLPVVNCSPTLNLLYVGAIHREKGIIELLDAVSHLPKDLSYHLDICGVLTDNSISEQIELLKNELGDKLSFRGYVTGREKIDEFMKADILLLPSYHEGLPLVILEALGVGCAIITTRVGAIPEILTDDNCMWVRIGSSEDIINAIEGTKQDILMQMKRNNKEKGRLFSIDNHIQKLSILYKKCKA